MFGGRKLKKVRWCFPLKILLTAEKRFHTGESIKERVKCYFNPFFLKTDLRGKNKKNAATNGKRKSASANDRKTLTLQGFRPAALKPWLR